MAGTEPLSERIALTACALMFGLGLPWLEINPTHAFNPAWPAHARLHEVWQLATNLSIAALCVAWVWCNRDLRQPALLTLLVTGGFIIACLLQDLYGGSLVHPDGTEIDFFRGNAVITGFGAVMLIAAAVYCRVEIRESPRPLLDWSGWLPICMPILLSSLLVGLALAGETGEGFRWPDRADRAVHPSPPLRGLPNISAI